MRIKKSFCIILIVLMQIGLLLFLGCEDKTSEEKIVFKEYDGFSVYLRDKEISSIFDDGEFILAGGVEGLYRIRKEDMSIEEIEFGEPLQMVRAILRDDEGNLLIGHDNGLTIISDDEIRVLTVKDGLPDNRINYIEKGSNRNELWISTYTGVGHFINDKWVIYNEGNGLSNNAIFPILSDSKKNIWFGAYAAKNSGICILINEGFIYFNTDNGLINNNITSFVENKDGEIWVGTGIFEEGGANLLKYTEDGLKIIKTLTIEDGLAGEKVRGLYYDSEGRVWFCSEYDGVAIFDSNGEKRKLLLNTSNGLSDNEIKRMFQDENGDYWLGARRGITFIKKEIIQNMIGSSNF